MKKSIITTLCGLMLCGLSACKDTESYADLLRDESYAVNVYLANYPVITSVPADREFISTVDIVKSPEFQAEFGHLDAAKQEEQAIRLTPYYRMDDEGYVYMQVVNPGSGEMAIDDQQVFFRFTRLNLGTLYKYGSAEATGNESDVASNPTSFRFKNTTLSSTTQWGEGIQTPLEYLPLNCRVNLIVKSYLGPVEEVSSVYPYLYSIRYYPSKI